MILAVRTSKQAPAAPQGGPPPNPQNVCPETAPTCAEDWNEPRSRRWAAFGLVVATILSLGLWALAAKAVMYLIAAV